MAGPRWVNPALVLCSLRDYLNALLFRCLGREHPCLARVTGPQQPRSALVGPFVLRSPTVTSLPFGSLEYASSVQRYLNGEEHEYEFR